jgi:glycogen operon protein
MELLIFDDHDDPEPIQIIRLQPEKNRTFFFWHVFVEGLEPGMHYACRVEGPENHQEGYRFNPKKVLIDPYAYGNTSALWNRVGACGPDDNLATSIRSVVIDRDDYDWEGDAPPRIPMEELIIYELHVKGFTCHPSSGVTEPGKFRGIIEKIPYLKSLGVTAVELLPVFEFDETEVVRLTPDGTPLMNYWGYSTVSFFAPHRAYCSSPHLGTHLTEFRDMVKALHRAGIEVILDVVFNHTNEGNEQGPTMNLRGFDNTTYYHLVVGNRQYYMDYSGCGNTLNCNHPVVRKFILDSLRFWVKEMHVDGFRFDEGSILSRGEDGGPMRHAPVLWDLELDDEFADTKLIAEAWDAAGLYQIGTFPGYRWAEWNGRYRDDVRRFVKGDPGLVSAMASRIGGSADLYQPSGHKPSNSINFVTCHDGFTLNDLVSYNEKHNWANGEGNRDGIDENLSWNCGFEGYSTDPVVESLRVRQIKNFATIQMVSRGVPMIVAGDEARRTQRGNNNAYCQDNETSWLDWSLVAQNEDLVRYYKGLIALRKAHPALRSREFFSGRVTDRGVPEVRWHGCELDAPGWDDPTCRVLSFTLGGFYGKPDLHVICNMDYHTLPFSLPVLPGQGWRRVADTALPSPDDICIGGVGPYIEGTVYLANGRSCVVLVSG